MAGFRKKILNQINQQRVTRNQQPFMTARLPDFLLAGAAKCGTTSIAGYLSQHPDIYVSPIKEPKFFTAQFLTFPLKGPGDSFVENFTVKTFDAYQRLFRRVRYEKAIGDASVDNLYFHKEVIPLNL